MVKRNLYIFDDIHINNLMSILNVILKIVFISVDFLYQFIFLIDFFQFVLDVVCNIVQKVHHTKVVNLVSRNIDILKIIVRCVTFTCLNGIVVILTKVSVVVVIVNYECLVKDYYGHLNDFTHLNFLDKHFSVYRN